MHTTIKIYNKQFSPTHIEDCEYIKKVYSDRYNLTPINNIVLILQKLKESTKGHYVECGTFQGKTLIPAALYCQHHTIFQDRKLFGMDSFEGFPVIEHHANDLPNMFEQLYSTDKITKDHYDKAKSRTDNFKSLQHLENDYFLNIGDIVNKCNKFHNVNLIKGLFQDTTATFKEDIAVLHIDADLYESYLICLTNLYNNVVQKGVIIFDEYYSHKYPGARIAVDEFFADKDGCFEVWVTSEGHERWCWVKN